MKRTNEQAQAFINELHQDVYNAIMKQKMTVAEVAKIMRISEETIIQMIQTYQERLERGAVA